MADPFKEMANMFDNRAKEHAARAFIFAPELGMLTQSGLKLDNFKHEIKSYLVAEYLKLDGTDMTTTEFVADHEHGVKTPSQLRPLAAGDRVLAVPVNGGRDFVVIARVV